MYPTTNIRFSISHLMIIVATDDKDGWGIAIVDKSVDFSTQ
jgi:hypothetical protein